MPKVSGVTAVSGPLGTPPSSPLGGLSAAAMPQPAPVQSLKPVVATTAKSTRPHVEAWTLEDGSERPISAPASSPKKVDPIIAEALENAEKVDSFFRTTFKRNGWDDKGTPLRIVVHTPDQDGQPLNNAYWDRERGKIYLGDGDGKIFSPLGGALDVLTHEATHALVDSEVNLRYSGQQGGINESWADVMGALSDPRNWKIGEGVFTPGNPGDAIRDLQHPRFDTVKSLPVDGDVDVHDLSGIPSLAAVKVAAQVGRDHMGQIWYHALTDHLDSRSGFAGAARATLESAKALYGEKSKDYAAVLDAWKAVGVNPRLPK